MAYAFRCRSCNSLEDAASAGENATPRRCRTCGKGGAFDALTGLFVVDESNWIRLADLPPAELASILNYHGIDASEIEGHTPFSTAWEKQDRILRLDYDDGSTETVRDSFHAPVHTPLVPGVNAPATRAPRLVSVTTVGTEAAAGDLGVAVVATTAAAGEGLGTNEGAIANVAGGG